jgi:hypothetical protein
MDWSAVGRRMIFGTKAVFADRLTQVLLEIGRELVELFARICASRVQ